MERLEKVGWIVTIITGTGLLIMAILTFVPNKLVIVVNSEAIEFTLIILVVILIGTTLFSIYNRHKVKRKTLAHATTLIEKIRGFIDEPPQKRLMLGAHVDQQALRNKAIEYNDLVIDAKRLIGFNLNMDTVNPDLLAQTNLDWHYYPDILPKMDLGWGHLMELAQKLHGEIEAYKRELMR